MLYTMSYGTEQLTDQHLKYSFHRRAEKEPVSEAVRIWQLCRDEMGKKINK